MCARENVTEILEVMIDRHGLLHVLTGLELVCSEKAEHIRTNWQDKTTASAWDVMSRKLYKLASDCLGDIVVETINKSFAKWLANECLRYPAIRSDHVVVSLVKPVSKGEV